MDSIQFVLNGKPVSAPCHAGDLLADVLRDIFCLTGTKEGCGKGECGACTVILNGQAVNSCLILMSQVQGSSVVTIEGEADAGGLLSGLQKAFVEEGAVQCGYCTPGMIMSGRALLESRKDLTEEDIREAIAGNLCRCTGYSKIVRAIGRAARDRKEGDRK